MAVFHLKVSVGSRAGGQSAVAKADYIEREGRYEQDREELEHKEHGNMPEWAEEDPRSSALYAAHPSGWPGRGESPCAPDDLGAGQ